MTGSEESYIAVVYIYLLRGVLDAGTTITPNCP